MENNKLTLVRAVLLSITMTAPLLAEKKMTLLDLLNSTTGYSSRSATVAGVRGLEETNGTIDTKARNYVAIEKLEHVVVHEEDLKRFLDEGKLK
jgi:hypothetical protein